MHDPRQGTTAPLEHIHASDVPSCSNTARIVGNSMAITDVANGIILCVCMILSPVTSLAVLYSLCNYSTIVGIQHFIMSGEGAIYLVAVSGGQVVDKQNTLLDKFANGNKSQHWTIEYGADPNQVAFQNVGNGAWLRAFSGAAYGKIDTGEKQWWTLSDGPSPGSKW